MSKILLGVPVVPKQAAKAMIVTRRASEGGLRLGLLDNTKGNANHLLALLAEGIKRDIQVVSVVSLRKASVSAPARVEILDQLAAQSDFVVSAIAD